MIISYLKPFNFVLNICINSYLKLELFTKLFLVA